LDFAPAHKRGVTSKFWNSKEQLGAFPCEREAFWNSFLHARAFGTAFCAQALFWNSFLRASTLMEQFSLEQLYGVNSRFVVSPPSFFKRRQRREYFWLFEKGNSI